MGIVLTDNKKRLLNNFLSLSSLEILNYILPFLTFPYLVRVLGPAKFGAVAFAQAFLQLFVVLSDYGYYLSAPRRIAIDRENRNSLNRIFSNVMSVKFILNLLCLGIVILLIASIKKFSINFWLYFFSFGYVVGDLMFPAWFFQGMEKMKFITVLYFAARIIFLGTIFIFVRSGNDYVLVPVLNAIGMIAAGLVSFIIIFKHFHVEFSPPSPAVILREIREGWHYFLSALSVSVCTYSGTFILGLFANSTFVGYYSAAERIIRAIQRMLWAMSQSVYPFVNKLASESKEKALIFLRKYAYVAGAFFFFVSVVVFIFAQNIVNILLGDKYQPSVSVLLIISFLPFIMSFSNLLGVQTMLSFQMEKAYSRIMLLAALINVGLCFVLTPWLKHVGSAIAILATEVASLSVMFSYVRSKKLKTMQVPSPPSQI